MTHSLRSLFPLAARFSRDRALVVAAVVAIGALGTGCKPQVGDACKQSTDCSVSGDRLCDTSMPDGYCTLFNCEPDGCPGDSICVEFQASNERLARSFCMAPCDEAKNCRAGYRCASIGTNGNGNASNIYDAKLIDTYQTHDHICLP